MGRERIPHPDPATIPTGPPGGRMPVRAWKSPPLRRRSGTKRSCVIYTILNVWEIYMSRHEPSIGGSN